MEVVGDALAGTVALVSAIFVSGRMIRVDYSVKFASDLRT